jgi:secreted PhoX family phosphatase
MRKKLLVPLAVMLTLASATVASVALAHPLGTANFVNDPNGIIKLQAGYSYTTVAVMCTPARSTESGVTFPLPEDPDGNVLFQAPSGEMWLLNNHELTQPRPGDFGGDVGKCHVPEQRPGDDDSDGWGSVSRLTLDKDGTTVKLVEVITTGLHNLCAAAITPWKTYLTNEEFPFINDPELRSGWVWEIDPETGASKRLTGMGRFSHEQEAYASDGNWYLTDDRGDARFIYKFEPTPDARDLTTGELYGLAFNKATMTGTWIGPLNPLDPDSDMRARGFQPAVWGFVKAEGIIGQGSSDSMGGNYVVFSESGAGADPGRIWKLTHLGNDDTVRGEVLVEGDFARLSRPDNIRFNDAGDLFIMEDHSASDFRRATPSSNQIWVLPRHQEGADALVLFGDTGLDEPTGPWFSFDNQLLYVSIQADPPRVSRIIAIRHPQDYNRPYDRPVAAPPTNPPVIAAPPPTAITPST